MMIISGHIGSWDFRPEEPFRITCNYEPVRLTEHGEICLSCPDCGAEYCPSVDELMKYLQSARSQIDSSSLPWLASHIEGPGHPSLFCSGIIATGPPLPPQATKLNEPISDPPTSKWETWRDRPPLF